MKGIVVPVSRQFSTAKPSSSVPKFCSSPLTEELCNQILDAFPDIKSLKRLHSSIFVDKSLNPNASLGIKIMRAYSARNEPKLARQVFDEITDKNVVVYNVMIRSYVNNHEYNDALILFKCMSGRGFNPDHYTYPCALKGCSGSENLLLGVQIHCSTVKVGLNSNLFNGNGLISMYAKCGCLEEASKVFQEMPRRDVVSWNTMVSGYAGNGRFDEAIEVCREMELVRVNPDACTMASLLPAVTNTSYVNVAYVQKIFTDLGKTSLVSWNVMISVFVKNSMPAEAIDLYLQMEAHGMNPDTVTLASVLPACGDLSALLLGKRIHEYVEGKNMKPNLLLENALIDMYAKCGALKEAREVFDGMKYRDVVSWTSMISAYGMTGQGRDAVALFPRMQSSGLLPDSIAFVSVLSACSHAGLLDEGQHYFKLMTEEYKIIPRIEHFACMVDLLGRGGKIAEAYDFIRKMPIEPNDRVWGALLSSCRVYNSMDIGVVAADHLFQLKPQQSGYYVLLSNIYAKAGRWEEVTTIRSIMKSKGIKKVPGISNFELNGHVYTFLVGDRSHAQSKEMYEELDVLVGKMKELGYVPEIDSALHDVEEEDKEGHLAVHSEKLAIVFALLNTKPGTPIRITKNLRVCGDCHVAAKLISKIAERGIIIRDNNRFHNFSGGICSCGDYW